MKSSSYIVSATNVLHNDVDDMLELGGWELVKYVKVEAVANKVFSKSNHCSEKRKSAMLPVERYIYHHGSCINKF